MQHVPLRVVLPPAAWDDYIAFAWAHYPWGGYCDTLREYGINGEQVGRGDDCDWVKDHNFDFYVDQMGYEVFAYYHKFRGHWDSVMEQYAKDPRNVQLRHRENSLSNPLSFDKLEDCTPRPSSVMPMTDRRSTTWRTRSASATRAAPTTSAGTIRVTRLLPRHADADVRDPRQAQRRVGHEVPELGGRALVQPTTYWQYDRLYRDIYLPRDFQVANSDRS